MGISRKAKLFIIYFPIILVIGQIGVNMLYFLSKPTYLELGFYLNTFFGTNVFFSIFLVAFTFCFKFCSVSKWASIAELLFAINFMVVKEDNLYNILFQIIVGLIAIIVTLIAYVKKFPKCNFSVGFKFFWKAVTNGSCKRGLREIDITTKRLAIREVHEKRHG